ncbi:MAG TPA: universal stress protein [Gaiellaceae bacterium]|nr:universal stress protein [Gaiellaceae bacterium]
MNGPVICGIEDASDDGVAGIARELADRYDLPLSFVHVLDGADGHEEAVRLLRETTAPGNGEFAVVTGHPADSLVELARARGASFLVLGNHGPRAPLLGSISADVSRRASCPVVVVPPTIGAIAQAEVGRSDPDVRGGIIRFGQTPDLRRVA